ncbi:DUF3576 domain-containing protein [Amylibacter marinus]|nr:DUF3576 domain-containing protein [Amylibacter marinus]
MKASIGISVFFTVSALLLTACGEGTTAPQEPKAEEKEARIQDLFLRPDASVSVVVNKYLWNASLDVLNFLPVESADPFTGVLSFGYGRAPGSGTAYRATVLVSGPALDARSLRVSVQTRGGTASAETQRQIENAILTRARQIRIATAKR